MVSFFGNPIRPSPTSSILYVYSMSWTLLVSCNSFKLKVVQKMIMLSEMPITNHKYLKLPNSAKQFSTWSTQRRNLADGPSADNLGLLPGWNVPKVATSFGHRPQMWLGRLGEQHGTTSCNLKSPYVSVFLCPGKMDDSIRHLTPVS